MPHDRQAEQVGIDGVLCRLGQRRGAQPGVSHLQRLRSDMLQTALIQGVRRGGGRMILIRPPDEGQIDPRQPLGRRHGEVGAVRHQSIDEDRQGVAGRAARHGAGGPRIVSDDAGVARPCLEHHGPTAAAPRLQIDDGPDPVAPRMGGEERPRTVQIEFLGVGQQDDQIAVRPAARLDRPHRLQNGRHARRIVGRTGRTGHAVVMGHHKDGGPVGVAAGQDADDVGRRQPVRASPLALQPLHSPWRQGAGLYPGRQAQGCHPLHQIGLDPRVVVGPDWMWRAGDLAHIGHRPRGGKGFDRGRDRPRRGRLTGDHGQTQGDSQRREQQDQPHRLVPLIAIGPVSPARTTGARGEPISDARCCAPSDCPWRRPRRRCWTRRASPGRHRNRTCAPRATRSPPRGA